ncbi:MAG: ATP-grasp domain-containing protein [Vicinamibacterales bacterium]
MKRVLLVATTTGYQTRMFADAADRLGVELIYATDRCDQLDDPWRDGAIAVRYHEEAWSAEAVVAALQRRPIDGILVVGDRPTVLAALVARALGLPGNSPAAALAARDKRLARECFRADGLLGPSCFTVPASTNPESLLQRLWFPVVLKPTVLSGSRGVIRASDRESFVEAFQRLQRLLASTEVRELRDDESNIIQIESYIPGVEYAVESLLHHGELQVLAIFDKPDPLEGPFFEETIYVTPSRASAHTQKAIVNAVRAAAAALGLHHGPIHAECRVNVRGVYVLEVAARPIGGLCARALRFVNHEGDICGLEELLLRHAIGEPLGGWRFVPLGSAVMMVPIPKGGLYRSVHGLEAARAVRGVDDVRITAKADQRLVPLPEGASYLGFIFARAATPEAAENAVRLSHEQLRFEIDPVIEVLQR